MGIEVCRLGGEIHIMTTRGQTTTEKRVVLLGSALSLIPRRPLGLALCLLFHLLLLSVARAEDSADAETLESTKHRILFENLFLEAANTRGAERKAHEGWWERLSDDAAGETSLLFVTPMFRSNLHLKYAPEEVEVGVVGGAVGETTNHAPAARPSDTDD